MSSSEVFLLCDVVALHHVPGVEGLHFKQDMTPGLEERAFSHSYHGSKGYLWLSLPDEEIGCHGYRLDIQENLSCMHKGISCVYAMYTHDTWLRLN